MHGDNIALVQLANMQKCLKSDDVAIAAEPFIQTF